MAYFNSKKIKVFPCAYRSAECDPEARSMTEYGLTHLYGTPSKGQESFIVSWDNTGTENEGLLKCVIGGYYFEISDVKIADFSGGKTLCIKTAVIPATQAQGEDGSTVTTAETTVLTSFEETGKGTELDRSGNFTGLLITDTNEPVSNATAWLKPVNDDGTINQESKRLTDVIKTGSGIGAITSASTTIGAGAIASGDYSIAFGAGAEAIGANSIAFGANAKSTTANQIVINTTAGNDDIIKIGNEVYVKTNGDAKIGNLKLSGGTNDANGTLSGMADVSATRNASFGGSITVGQNAYFGGSVTATGSALFGGSVTTSGDLHVGGSVTVTNDAQFNKNITAGGNLTGKSLILPNGRGIDADGKLTAAAAVISGAATICRSVTITGESVIENKLTVGGALTAQQNLNVANGISAKSISLNAGDSKAISATGNVSITGNITATGDLSGKSLILPNDRGINADGRLTVADIVASGLSITGSVTVSEDVKAKNANVESLAATSITIDGTKLSKADNDKLSIDNGITIAGEGKEIDVYSISVNTATISNKLDINGIELKKDHIAAGSGSNDVLDINNGVKATSFYTAADGKVSAAYISSSSASFNQLRVGGSTTAALTVNSTSITASKQIWANNGLTANSITTGNAYIASNATVIGNLQSTSVNAGSISTTGTLDAKNVKAGSISTTGALEAFEVKAGSISTTGIISTTNKISANSAAITSITGLASIAGLVEKYANGSSSSPTLDYDGAVKIYI